MLILVLLGMYFDAVVVFVTSQIFRLALAILCGFTFFCAGFKFDQNLTSLWVFKLKLMTSNHQKISWKSPGSTEVFLSFRHNFMHYFSYRIGLFFAVFHLKCSYAF
jgi:hypothetical protein